MVPTTISSLVQRASTCPSSNWLVVVHGHEEKTVAHLLVVSAASEVEAIDFAEAKYPEQSLIVALTDDLRPGWEYSP